MKKLLLLSSVILFQFSSYACTCWPDGPTDLFSTVSQYTQEYLVVFDTVLTSEEEFFLPQDKGYFNVITVIKDVAGHNIGDTIVIEGGMSSLCQNGVSFTKNDTLLVTVSGLTHGYYLNNCRQSFIKIENGMYNGEKIDDLIARLNPINTIQETNAITEVLTFPSPATDVIDVISKPSAIINIEIIDKDGVSLFNKLQPLTHRSSVLLSNYAEGVYTLRIKTKSGKIVNKRVCKH